MTHSPASTRAILAVRTAARGLLATSDGEPIWPVHSEAEWRDLANWVEHLGGTLVRASASAGPVPPVRSREWVVGLGADTDTGMLYAHLTGRRFMSADSPPFRLPPGDVLAVVVTRFRHVTAELLEHLYPQVSDDPVPGLVVAADRRRLRKQVLLRSIAARLAPAPEGPRAAAFFGIVSSPVPIGSDTPTLGAHAPRERVRALLTEGAGVLGVWSHSDGIDAFLTPELTTCGMGSLPTYPTGRVPYCVETGYCFRHGEPVSAFVSSPRHLDPIDLRCHLLVWGVCFGILPFDGVLDPEGGLLARLLENPFIGAIATPWGVVSIGRDDMETVLAPLAQGVLIGEAVARLHGAAHADGSDLRMCIIGDPRARLKSVDRRITMSYSPRGTAASPVRRREAPTAKVGPQPIARPPAEGPDWAGVVFLRALLSLAAANASGELLTRAQQALLHTQLYEFAAWKGEILEGASDSPGSQLRASVLDYLHLRGPTPYIYWSRLTCRRSRLPDEPCPNCGGAARCTRMDLRLPGSHARRLVNCGRCGVVADLPEGSDLRLRVSDHTLHLSGTLPKGEDWRAAAVLNCHNNVESVRIDWPRNDGQRPRNAVYVEPSRWPPGVVVAGFVCLHRAELTYLQVASRRGHS